MKKSKTTMMCNGWLELEYVSNTTELNVECGIVINDNPFDSKSLKNFGFDFTPELQIKKGTKVWFLDGTEVILSDTRCLLKKKNVIKIENDVEVEEDGK